MREVVFPVTTAIRELRSAKISFEPYLYDYVEKGGTAASSAALGVSEHDVIKTLVMEDDSKKPLIILMHGDLTVSTKALARELNVKSVSPCEPKTAEKHTGYVVGGTSPFGTRTNVRIFAERSIFDLSAIYINGGKRGFLVKLSADDLKSHLNPTLVNVGLKAKD